MASKTVPVEEAVGLVLPHDVTEIRTLEKYGKDDDFTVQERLVLNAYNSTKKT